MSKPNFKHIIKILSLKLKSNRKACEYFFKKILFQVTHKTDLSHEKLEILYKENVFYKFVITSLFLHKQLAQHPSISFSDENKKSKRITENFSLFTSDHKSFTVLSFQMSSILQHLGFFEFLRYIHRPQE